MSVRNSHTGKAARRAARQSAAAAQTEQRDPGAVALELVRVVLHGKSGGDLAEARKLLPDSAPADFMRRVVLHLADLAAAVVISEAGSAGIERGAYLDGLIRRRQDGGGHGR